MPFLVIYVSIYSECCIPVSEYAFNKCYCYFSDWRNFKRWKGLVINKRSPAQPGCCEKWERGGQFCHPCGWSFHRVTYTLCARSRLTINGVLLYHGPGLPTVLRPIAGVYTASCTPATISGAEDGWISAALKKNKDWVKVFTLPIISKCKRPSNLLRLYFNKWRCVTLLVG